MYITVLRRPEPKRVDLVNGVAFNVPLAGGGRYTYRMQPGERLSHFARYVNEHAGWVTKVRDKPPHTRLCALRCYATALMERPLTHVCAVRVLWCCAPNVSAQASTVAHEESDAASVSSSGSARSKRRRPAPTQGAKAAGPSASGAPSAKTSPEGQQPAKRRTRRSRTAGMEIENDVLVRNLMHDHELMPPPAAPYSKLNDPALNPLSINKSACVTTAGSGQGVTSAQPTPTKGPSTHVMDTAKSYAAAAAATKTTPKTEENTRVLQSADPVIQEQLVLQRASLAPRGRVQQLFTARPTVDEQRAHRTQKRREQRARAKLLEQHHTALMRRLQDVGQFSEKGLELWELLMIEFAMQPSNVGSAGEMRTRYLEQLYAARLKEHVPRQRGIGLLPELSRRWRGVKSIAISTIVDVAPQMRRLAAANGLPDEWVLRRGGKYSPPAEAAIEAHEKVLTWADLLKQNVSKAGTGEAGSSSSGSKAQQQVAGSSVQASDVRVEVDILGDDDGDESPATDATATATLTPESVELRLSNNMLVTSAPIMARNSELVLNDLHIANLTALMPRPERRQLQANYPRDYQHAADVFKTKSFRSMLDGTRSLDGAVQDYAKAGHWYTLMLSFGEKVVYFFEAFGSKLSASSRITNEMVRHLGSEWRMISLECDFQTCVSACGLWVMEAKRAFVDYLDSESYGSNGFKQFLQSWMEAKGVIDLKPLEYTPRYASAKASNFNYITSCREDACNELAEAAAGGKLAWTEGSGIQAFHTKGSKRLKVIELEARDEVEADELPPEALRGSVGRAPISLFSLQRDAYS